MKKLLIHLSILSILAAVALPMVSCAPQEEEGPMEEMGEEMDEGMEEMGEAMEEGADEMEDGAEEMGDEMDEGMEETAEPMDEENGMEEGGMEGEEEGMM